ncbi:MAG: hypothetical protein K0U40_09040 [Betaproteobacteria bacterium]|nr:hypothetical protein [Betaproteobacteria bacterium]
MFDKPNQLVFYANVVAIVFGAIVVVFSDFIITGTIFIICGALLIFEQIKQNKAAFTISELKKILTIHDTGGSKATQAEKQVTAACHVENKIYWFRNVPAIGSISNFRIDGATLDDQKKENGAYHICAKIPAGLKATDGFDLTLACDYQNAFTKTEGVLSHVVNDDTRQLHLIVELPKGRPVTSAKLYCKHNGVEQALLPPVITGETKIESEIQDPILGAEYCLQWNWPEESVVKKIGRMF